MLLTMTRHHTLTIKAYLKLAKQLVNTSKSLSFSYDPEEIIVTNGASEAIDTTLRSIIEPGDEIIIPGPIYAGYIPLIEVLGGKPIYIDTTATQFKITPDALEVIFLQRQKLSC